MRAAKGTYHKAIVTPEGVPLDFQIASAGERAGAYITDMMIVMTAIAIAILVLSFTGAWFTFMGGAFALVAFIMLMLVVFGLRYFYFIFFEIRWQGRTPGKRLLGLRVIDRNGGPLTSEAVIARNLTREFETLFPFLALFFPSVLIPNAPGWAALLATLWLVIFMLMPLFNRERLRIGDMIGGTLVVQAPRRALLQDLTAGRGKGPQAKAVYRFTRAQLDMYGIYELQVLEQLLRRSRVEPKVQSAVCNKIKRKIAWSREQWDVDPERFLEDFYKAQRARLEHKMLFGKRQERKQRGRLKS